MAFKQAPPTEIVPDSPEKILLQLPRRKIPGVLLHQGQMMQRYVAEAQDQTDVALQLPTGSGKTLVGLLIGEWLRRKNTERVVFLCPTRQLVNQVVAQAEGQYGLSVHGFTGQKATYNPTAKADYQAGRRLAVTTYSALFNSYPFFDSPNVIIADDAHAAENYIASMWSVRIERNNPEHAALHTALSEILLKSRLDSTDYGRLTGQLDDNLVDISWCDKLPTPTFSEISGEFAAIVDQHVGGVDDLRYPWMLVRGHLDACHLYLTPQEIYLRPLIPPTWTHAPFADARQRIFMSATLGEGGDLERLTGRKNIHRLPVPPGWDRQGIGRRFFIFPEMALTEDESVSLRQTLMTKVPRSVVLVPNDRVKNEIASDAANNLGLTVFDAAGIEESKASFISSKATVAVFANRYDGIDFPGDECRLLFLDGLPRTTNAQERFFVTRMGAGVLLQGRIQTRVVQAVGRCTRSLQDYSAVVVTGAELTDYLNSPSRLCYFHPELQAELDFGARQSSNTTLDDLIENFEIFLENGPDWEAVNRGILAKRDAATQQVHPGVPQLQAVVGAEIDYQQNLWQGHYEGAVDSAGHVLAGLTEPSLKGYRALWQYLAGAAASYGERSGVAAMAARARSHFANARDAAGGIRWLSNLARFQPGTSVPPVEKQTLDSQIERLESLLLKLGMGHQARYVKNEKAIIDGLASTNAAEFEIAHRDLGEMLGFRAGKHEADASPNPWWIAGDFCIVFEDHSNAKAGSALGADKARQADGHPKWMRANKELTQLPENAEILSVLVTPVSRAEDGALPHLANVAFWPLDEFRKWAVGALGVVRELRRTLGDDCDLAWRAQAQAVFEQNGFDAPSLYRRLANVRADKVLKR
jgi:hypothetical protein